MNTEDMRQYFEADGSPARIYNGDNPKPVLFCVDLFDDFVRKHSLAVESLTEQQLAEVIRQAVASGDIVRNVTRDISAQAIVYIPYREVSRLRNQYHELIYAVASKHDGETRHETALRYIREREESIEGLRASSPDKAIQ